MPARQQTQEEVMPRHYEVVIERKIRNVFTVEAVSRTDAAMKVGMQLAGDTPWDNTVEVEVDKRMTTPEVVEFVAVDTGDDDSA
jgi:hypothetical protein